MQGLDESSAAVGEGSGGHERVSDVRAPDRAANGRERHNVLPRNRVVGGQVCHHSLRSGFAVFASSAEIFDEAGVGRVEEVGQQVHGNTRGRARHFGTPDKTDARGRNRSDGLVPPGRRVVVG